MSGRITKGVLACFLTILIAMLAVPGFAANKEKDEDTLRQATIVLQDMLNSRDVWPTLLAKANCVLILPRVKKFGVGVAGAGGHGPMLCRTGEKFDGQWSAPAMYTVGGVSVGLQAGGWSTDFVLLLMNQKVVNQVLKGKTTIGEDATAAAGPGATAASVVDSNIATYGRTKGVFAGMSVGGATLHLDEDATYHLYGKRLTAEDIVRRNEVTPPAGSDALVSLLNSKIVKNSN
jgi:lipid-binding SYLF domain-containing protein